MAYFKQHWPEHLHDDVLHSAEEVVSQPSDVTDDEDGWDAFITDDDDNEVSDFEMC